MTTPTCYLSYFIVAVAAMACGYVAPAQWVLADWVAVVVISAVFVRCAVLEARLRSLGYTSAP